MPRKQACRLEPGRMSPDPPLLQSPLIHLKGRQRPSEARREARRNRRRYQRELRRQVHLQDAAKLQHASRVLAMDLTQPSASTRAQEDLESPGQTPVTRIARTLEQLALDPASRYPPLPILAVRPVPRVEETSLQLLDPDQVRQVPETPPEASPDRRTSAMTTPTWARSPEATHAGEARLSRESSWDNLWTFQTS
jgi:hypothetical protein